MRKGFQVCCKFNEIPTFILNNEYEVIGHKVLAVRIHKQVSRTKPNTEIFI